MLKIKLLISIVSMLFAVSSVADTLKEEKDLKTFSSYFLEITISKGVIQSFEKMEPYIVLPKEQLRESAKSSKAQRISLKKVFGESIEYEFISEDRLGNSLIRLKYLEKAERGGIFWEFYYYKGKDGWFLSSFKWSDKIQQFFKD